MLGFTLDNDGEWLEVVGEVVNGRRLAARHVIVGASDHILANLTSRCSALDIECELVIGMMAPDLISAGLPMSTESFAVAVSEVANDVAGRQENTDELLLIIESYSFVPWLAIPSTLLKQNICDTGGTSNDKDGRNSLLASTVIDDNIIWTT